MNIVDIRNKLPRNGTQDSAHVIGAITHIIVHHDAQWRPDAYDDLTRYIQQANFHIGRGEDGLQYHYKISNLGDVYQLTGLRLLFVWMVILKNNSQLHSNFLHYRNC